MQSFKEALVWIWKNKLILAFCTYTILFLWSLVVIYRFVDEVLSIAQRGYFFSVPAMPFKGLKTPSIYDLDNHRGPLVPRQPCLKPPEEALPHPSQKE